MEEVGRIKKIKGTRALVEIKPVAFCGQCANRPGCAIFDSSGVKIIEVRNPVGAKEGELVKVVFDEKKEVLSSLLLFLLPVIFLFIGIILAGLWGAIFGLAVAFFLLKLGNDFLNKKEVFLPRVISVIDCKEEK